jgi:hypothetical protein
MMDGKLRIADCRPLLDDGLGEIGFVAKGRRTAAEMVAAIRRYAVEQRDASDPLAAFEFDDERHRIHTAYYRWLPCPPAWEAPYNCRLEMSQMGRGAFVATVVWL